MAGAGLLVGGCALLVICLLGFTSLGRYASLPPRGGESFDAGLAATTPSLSRLYHAAETSTPVLLSDMSGEEALDVLYATVIARFTHGNQTRHGMFGNWAAWLRGHWVPSVGWVRNPDTILRLGHSALCSEQSAVLALLSDRAGIPARRVWLNGHVVMEAFYDEGWHAYDPDMEVVPRGPDGRVLSVEAMIADPDTIREAYGRWGPEKVEQLVGIIGSERDNRNDSHPGFSDALSAERMTVMWKWTIPLSLIVAGALLLRPTRSAIRRTRNRLPVESNERRVQHSPS